MLIAIISGEDLMLVLLIVDFHKNWENY